MNITNRDRLRFQKTETNIEHRYNENADYTLAQLRAFLKEENTIVFSHAHKTHFCKMSALEFENNSKWNISQYHWFYDALMHGLMEILNTLFQETIIRTQAKQLELLRELYKKSRENNIGIIFVSVLGYIQNVVAIKGGMNSGIYDEIYDLG
jgi:hypothetical protein